ncbi:MAG: S8 family serine peptidase [Candidatus Aminicenantes bacterium]|nr:S8 family serine peptidase [Candidatus Aminicenantes bacterium]
MTRVSILKTAVCLSLAGLLLFVPDSLRLQDASFFRQVDLLPCADPPRNKDPRLSSYLLLVAETYQRQGLEAARDLAGRRGLDAGSDALRLVAEADSARSSAGWETSSQAVRLAVEALKADVETFGGRVEAADRSWVQAVLPYSRLEAFLSSPTFASLAPPLRPRLQTTSEGVARTGADQWYGLPSFHGSDPVKICVLDGGFEGYKDLLGKELPPEDRVTTRSFRYDNNLEAGESHGTACAEIVHDMAPDAHLYLVNYSSSLEQASAVRWLISQEVKIISNSIGWFNAGAGDGTGPICDDVERAANGGILWVGSSGNYALDHWQGVFNDTDGDEWHNFSATDELLEFEAPAHDLVGAYLNWDDWGVWNGLNYSGSDQDYDLYLYRWNGVAYALVAESTDPQTGLQWPTEAVDGYSHPEKTNWAVAIRRSSATRNASLELFLSRGSNTPCEYNVPEGSLIIPCDAASHVSVGATDWSDDSYHAYSSRGPTQDGRIRPLFCAPSGVSTRTYGGRNFYGTSASAPHMAGAFGILLGKTPYDREDAMEMLIARVVDLGSPGRDNQFGHGRVDMRR